ncbi:MAG: Mth938-like domain-containing protein, partial [Burkholderiaceae bacterium]
YVEINKLRFTSPVIVAPERPIEPWNITGFDALGEPDFTRLRDLQPEILLLGTGARQRFPHPRLTRPLLDARIGLEAMDSHAACRTYNILMAEGRKVVAAILLDD